MDVISMPYQQDTKIYLNNMGALASILQYKSSRHTSANVILYRNNNYNGYCNQI